MDDTFHLLANPQYQKRKLARKCTLDDTLHTLLQRKFRHIDITKEMYDDNILKIETLFTDSLIDKTVTIIVDDLINQTINEQVLL